MIESIKNIKSLLIADVCEPILERHIVLREKKDNADMKVKVDVEELSGTGLKIHAEEGKEQRFHPSIVNAEKGYRRSCDYLIIGPNMNGIDVSIGRIRNNESVGFSFVRLRRLKL